MLLRKTSTSRIFFVWRNRVQLLVKQPLAECAGGHRELGARTRQVGFDIGSVIGLDKRYHHADSAGVAGEIVEPIRRGDIGRIKAPGTAVGLQIRTLAAIAEPYVGDLCWGAWN